MAGMAIGFLAGWLCYHFLMNRAVMMRYCCLLHFQTHDVCTCKDCILDRKVK